MQRYDWENGLIQAQADGIIKNGALLVALKLAKAINWRPRNGKQPGLYWKNDDALKEVGASRASFYRHRESLVETGFIVEVAGNLIPTLPEQSLGETADPLQVKKEVTDSLKVSLVETPESLGETEKSLGDNPLSVDVCSEDSLRDGAAAHAAAVKIVDEELGRLSSASSLRGVAERSEAGPPSSLMPGDSVENSRQSLGETTHPDHDTWSPVDKKCWAYLTYKNNNVFAQPLSDEQLNQVMKTVTDPDFLPKETAATKVDRALENLGVKK